MSKGFVPRGKNTLTSRLFILERVKQELDRQISQAKLNQQDKLSTTPSFEINKNSHDEEQDDDQDEELLDESILFEDLINNPDSCAFPTTIEKTCLTNQQVYNSLNNQSVLIQFSKSIEQQLNKPNEQRCTSIDLSSFRLKID